MVTYFARQFAKDAVRWPWIEVRRVSCLQWQNVASEINCRVLVTLQMTLARQRVLSSSDVRASDLEHGGSWVRIPSGAQIFSVSSYGRFCTSPFISLLFLFLNNKSNSIAWFSNQLSDWNKRDNVTCRFRVFQLVLSFLSYILSAIDQTINSLCFFQDNLLNISTENFLKNQLAQSALSCYSLFNSQ